MNPAAILHVDTETTWRGGQAQVLSLLEGLAARGHPQLLVAPDGPLAERARSKRIPVRVLTPRSDIDPVALVRLAAFAKRFQPGIVHAHTGRAHALAALTARLCGARSVVSRRVLFHANGAPKLSLKYRLPVDRYLCVSRAIRDHLERGGVPGARLSVVYDGVDVAGMDRDAAGARASGQARSLRQTYGVPEDGRLVGILAALTPEKDHATFLAAAALVLPRFPGARFAVVGEGSLRGFLTARAGALGLGSSVHFPGFSGDLPTLLAALDVLVLCSTHEGLGTSLLLGQAASIPVIGTRAGGIPEVIEHGRTGLLVPPGDPAALADAIAATLEDRAAREARVREARTAVERFDVGVMVEKTREVYRTLLESPSRIPAGAAA